MTPLSPNSILDAFSKLAPSRKRALLGLEFFLIFLLLPCVLYFKATRLNVHIALWCTSLYALVQLTHSPSFSWRSLWHGSGWSPRRQKIALLRLGVGSFGILLLTLVLVPDHLFSFPLQRPIFWAAVMVLYPLLSVIPQEFVLRSFFFRRYLLLFPQPWMIVAASAFCFGFVHIVLRNPVAPVLTILAGFVFAQSYSQHRSLKWVAIEHAAYGCVLFTIGLGTYFLVGGLHP